MSPRTQVIETYEVADSTRKRKRSTIDEHDSDAADSRVARWDSKSQIRSRLESMEVSPTGVLRCQTQGKCCLRVEIQEDGPCLVG